MVPLSTRQQLPISRHSSERAPTPQEGAPLHAEWTIATEAPNPYCY